MATQALADLLRYIRHFSSEPEGDEKSDGQLLQQFVAGRDEGAFAALLRRHGPLVFRVCRQVLGDAHDAEDAFQATFLVLARKAASIRRHASLAAWLHRVALNVARTARAHTAQRRAHERQAVLMAQASPVAGGSLHDWQPLLHEAVDALPEKYRLPVVLCYLEGKTHDGAARQLGWPLGTVKGRLARARELLRKRLARRGLALSAGGLATALTAREALGHVSAALLGHTLQGAVPFACGRAIPASAISAGALALANGALRTMTATKLASLVGLVLAVGVVGLAAALGRGPGRDPTPDDRPAAKEDRPAPPRAKAVDFGPEVAGLRAKVALAKEKFEVGEAIPVRYVVKNVSKEEQIVWHSGFWPNHLIVVHGANGKEPPLTALGQQRRQAFSPGGERDKNAPVTVPPGGEDAAYEPYDLTKLYDLSKPGRYTVQYVYEEKQGGWEGRLPSNEAAFAVVAARADRQPGMETNNGLAESKAVRAHGVDFRVFVDRCMRVPAVGTRWPMTATNAWLDLGLRVSNASDKPLVFYRGNVVRFTVSLPDGTPLRMGSGTDLESRMDPCTIEPGKELVLPGNAFLQWTPDGKTLALHGQENTGYYRGLFWSFEGLKPGKYLLSAEYTLENVPDPAQPVWLGKVKTEAVAFEIINGRAGLNESKAVRVNGVDFQALVEPKRAAPAPSGRQSIDLGFGIANPTEKTLLFNLYDTLQPVLTSADGKRFELTRRRLRTGPALPVLSGPGKVETVLYRAALAWLPDGAALSLFGPDGSGGTWHFEGLKPGKYFLSFAYANTGETLATFLKAATALAPRARPRPPEKGQSYWIGTVTTAGVEFEIGPPANKERGKEK